MKNCAACVSQQLPPYRAWKPVKVARYFHDQNSILLPHLLHASDIAAWSYQDSKTANDNSAPFNYPAYWWTSPTNLAPVIFIHFNSISLLCVHTEAQDSTDTHYDTFCETIRHAVTVHWNATHHVRVMTLPQTLMHSECFYTKAFSYMTWHTALLHLTGFIA